MSFGLYSRDFFSADYYPIFPWFGYFLLGFGCAHELQKRGYLHTLFGGEILAGRSLAFLGRHSLLIYSIHVPIVYGIIRLIHL